MKLRETLRSFVALWALAVFALYSSIVAVPPAVGAAAEATAALGKPAIVDLDAVTLELTFRGAATEGKFKATNRGFSTPRSGPGNTVPC